MAVVGIVAGALAAVAGVDARAVPVPGGEPATTTTAAPATTTTTAAPATTTTTTRPATTTTSRPATTTTTRPGPATTTTAPDETGTGGGSGDDRGGEPSVPAGPVPDDRPAGDGDGGGEQSPSTVGGDGTPPVAGPGSDAAAELGTPRLVPPQALQAMRSVVRTPARSTRQLLTLLEPLADAGHSDVEIARLGMGQFPVLGQATYSHDWWFPRYVPTFHLHQGTDVFAAMGTPVQAPFDGVVRITDGPVGGRSVYVTQPDGTFVYLGHLSGWADGLATGDRVKAGDVVGFVGDTGNARGSSPHVHLEIHPRGGPATDPKPVLDSWLDAAEANAPAVVSSVLGRESSVRAAAGLRFLAPGRHPAFDAPATPSRAAVLWAAAAVPEGAGVQLASAAAARLADEVDWDRRAAVAARRQAWWEEGDRRARAVLAPVTPPALARALAGEGLPE